MPGRKPKPAPPPLTVQVCTSCGEPFETRETDRTRCYVCPSRSGWRTDPCEYDDIDANRKAERDA